MADQKNPQDWWIEISPTYDEPRARQQPINPGEGTLIHVREVVEPQQDLSDEVEIAALKTKLAETMDIAYRSTERALVFEIELSGLKKKTAGLVKAVENELDQMISDGAYLSQPGMPGRPAPKLCLRFRKLLEALRAYEDASQSKKEK